VYVLALVVWLGGMLVLGGLVAPTLSGVLPTPDPASGRALAHVAFTAIVTRFQYVADVAGVLLFLTLTAMRILGPKPASFAVRALIILAMLGVSVYMGRILVPAQADALPPASTRLMAANIVGALALLYWEAKEHP
jgi:hypothetical protein